MKYNGKNTIRAKRGMYMSAISAIVIAIVIIFNLVIGSIPDNSLQYDISAAGLYTVSQQSAEYLKTLDTDVDIVVLAQEDHVSEQLQKFLNNYVKLSPHLNLSIIDPVLDPTALETYGAGEGSVIVSCAQTNKSKTISIYGLNDDSADGLIVCDTQAWYYYNQIQPVSLDAEGQLTSAIGFVTSTVTNNIYYLDGHGESQLGSLAAAAVSKANITTASVNLLKDGSIPADCNLLMCYNPQKDLANEELSMLKEYLRLGGKMMLISNTRGLTNFDALLAVYGLQMQDGFVGDTSRYMKGLSQPTAFCFYPVLSASSDVTSGISGDAIVIDAGCMLQVTPERRGSTLTPFISTSQSGIMYVDEDNITDGQYIVGATATETFDDDETRETRLTVITDVNFISDELLQYQNFVNQDIFMNAVNKNYSQQASSFIIPAKSLQIQQIAIPNSLPWVVLFIGIIPAATIIGGLVYWNKRRNR